MPAMQDDTFQPLGDSPVLTFELRADSEDNIPTRDRAHLRAERTIADTLEDSEVSLNIQTEKIGSSATTIVEGLLSPPPSPPRLRPRSPRETLRKSSGTMQALDDTYCDRIRSKRWAFGFCQVLLPSSQYSGFLKQTHRFVMPPLPGILDFLIYLG